MREGADGEIKPLPCPTAIAGTLRWRGVFASCTSGRSMKVPVTWLARGRAEGEISRPFSGRLLLMRTVCERVLVAGGMIEVELDFEEVVAGAVLACRRHEQLIVA